MRYTLGIRLDKNLCKAEVTKKVTYHQNENQQYQDDITYSGSQITIEGSRSKRINLDFLETVNSTQFSALITALVYAYFRFGSFKIEEFSVSLDGNEIGNIPRIETTRFSSNNIFGKLQDTDLSGLFGNMSESKVFQSALTNFTLASSNGERRFEHLWRGFNSLARYFTGLIKDSDTLKAIRKDMDIRPDAYKKATSWARMIRKEDLDEKLRVNLMILSYFPKGTKSRDGLKRWYTNYTDFRVLTLMKEKITCKQADLEELNILRDVTEDIDRKLALDKTYDIDIVRITVLKYAYYLRNKLFHAEKMPTYFLFDTANEEGISFLINPLVALCTDLMGLISSGKKCMLSEKDN